MLRNLGHHDLRHLGRLILLMLILPLTVSACGSLPAEQHSVSKPSTLGIQIVEEAKKLLGMPYEYGGNSQLGFDCSGLVQYTHRQLGIRVPRTARDQLAQIKPLKRSQLKPGDVLFFRINRGKSLHVAIYTGNNNMIHAPSSGKTVSHASLDIDYWQSRLLKIGRFY